MKKIVILFLGVSLFFGMSLQSSASQVEATSEPSLSYQVNVENKGWLPITKNGEIAGTTGQGLGIKGIAIAIHNSPYQGGVDYQVITSWGRSLDPLHHNVTYDNKSNGSIAGNFKANEIIESMSVGLTGELAKHYEIYVRAHISYFSWLDWQKGAMPNYVGSLGLNKKLEAVQISLIKKGMTPPKVGNNAMLSLPIIQYKSFSEKKGWNGNVSNSSNIAGSVGESIPQKLMSVGFFSDGEYSYPSLKTILRYRSYVQGKGWQPWVTQGQISGMQNPGAQQEAFQLEFTGGLEKHVDIYYRAHVAGTGWMEWVKNGAIAGTTGKNIRMEAYQIYIVYKNGPGPKLY